MSVARRARQGRRAYFSSFQGGAKRHAGLGLKEKTNGKGKFFVIQFANLKENAPEEKEVFRAMYFQFAGHTIAQTGDAEKKMKDDAGRRAVELVLLRPRI